MASKRRKLLKSNFSQIFLTAKPLELHKGCFEHCPDYLLEDDSLFDELEAPEEWFSDRRIGKWSEYRNGLTGKDLSEMFE